MKPPLADLRILSVEQYGAGPYGTLHLADLGADVIKIEDPRGGDVGRFVPPYRSDADSLFFQSLNRNKRSLSLDLATEAGRKVFLDLVKVSDGVFSNLRGDVPAKLGIQYCDLRNVNPRIVCCSLSGYGTSGPRASKPGFDYMVQGHAGWMSLTGDPDGPPTKAGVSVIDFSSGLVAALSLLVGIHSARNTGYGGDCDVSLFDTAISMLNYVATWHLTVGHAPRRTPQSGHPSIVPFGNFPTKDGWIVVGGSKEKFWRQLTLALRRPELANDPRFHSFDDRLKHRGELTAILNDAFRQRTTAEWLDSLEDHGVPCAPVNTVEQALRDPQVAARDLVFFQEHPVFGKIGQVKSPVRAYGTRPNGKLAPTLGEDTYTILTELLQYSEDQVLGLRDAGVIRLGPEPRP